MKQFSHSRYLPCCQCTETYSRVSSIQKYLPASDKCKQPSGESFLLMFPPNKTRPTLERRKTLSHLRSINPNMINHFASQSQTCKLLKIISFLFNIERKLWRVVQFQVELMRINFKQARIAPAFKKGSTCLAGNYRPISLTCVCCKILEHIFCSHIHKHLNKHNILTSQYGFHSRHSCESQLITTIHIHMLRYDQKSRLI